MLVDLPALSAADLSISRQGAKTIVRGGRKPPYAPGQAIEEVRTERRYGRFVRHAQEALAGGQARKWGVAPELRDGRGPIGEGPIPVFQDVVWLPSLMLVPQGT